MMNTSTTTIAVYAGLTSVIIGAATFALSWNLYDILGGPMPGTKVLLFPGSLTLIYVWHPLFTEEINFWPKFALQMFGQFLLLRLWRCYLLVLLKSCCVEKNSLGTEQP